MVLVEKNKNNKNRHFFFETKTILFGCITILEISSVRLTQNRNIKRHLVNIKNNMDFFQIPFRIGRV